jgi:hypothetical protein
MEAKKPQKNPKYSCSDCNFTSGNKKDFNRHMTTRKHSDGSIGSKIGDCGKQQITPLNDNAVFSCINCEKSYMSRGSLWKHKQKCKPCEIPYEKLREDSVKNEGALTNEMVLELIKQNKELQSVLVEQSSAIMEQSAALMEQNNKLVEITAKGSTHIQNMTNNTTNNNQFNINFFLNEQCKNAVSIIDFVNSLQVQIQDLEKTGKLGYVEGISSIFLKGLRELNVYERPIHCTDLKRETVYVKDKDSWEKESGEKGKLKLAIKQIARKNLRTLPKWQLENPDFVTLDTRENNEYLKIARNSLGGEDDEEEQKFTEKIIRNVLKDVLIDKNVDKK